MEKFSQKTVHGIVVVFPSLEYYKKVEQAIRFLKRSDAQAFEKVKKHIDVIFIFSKKGWYNEIRQSRDGTKWGWLVEGSAIIDESYPYQFIASELIHEAQHVIQYKSARKYTDAQAEKGAYLVQLKFLKKIGYDNAAQWLYEFFKEKWWTEKHRGSKEVQAKKSKKAIALFELWGSE
ncbi:MAG: hypothetical protein WDZ40_02980 [Candidatus Spechtbacterales bacterium]